MERVPHGIVERVDQGYVGYCHEVGTSAQGNTVEEAFANLNTATWEVLRDRGTDGVMLAGTGENAVTDEIAFYQPSETDPNSTTLAAVTAVLLDGLGEFETLNAKPTTV